MDDYIKKLMEMAVVIAPLVVIFLQLLKSAVPEKYFPTRLYPTAALIIGIIISVFVGSQTGTSIQDSIGVGFLATVVAILGFKYGKWEEVKSERNSSTK